MNYCTNCGTPLQSDVQFCTNCGQKVAEQPTSVVKSKKAADNPSSGKRFSRLLFLAGVVIVVGLVFWMIPDYDEVKDTLVSSKTIAIIEGRWYDPTGVILGDVQNVLEIVKKDDTFSGKDNRDIISIEFIPTGGNNFSARVILHGIPGDFEAHYDEEANKLTFFSTLTKSSWYLKQQ